MILIDSKVKDVEKDDNDKIKAYTLSVMMLEPVEESNKYYIKRNIQWRLEKGHQGSKIPSNYGLRQSNDNTYLLIRYLFSDNEGIKNGTTSLSCLSEEISIEYTPDVDEYFATGNHIYLNLTEPSIKLKYSLK